MISLFDTYFASIPAIAMKSTGCLRFPECPRAGGAGRMIFFKGQKAVLLTRANRDVANQASDRTPRFAASKLQLSLLRLRLEHRRVVGLGPELDYQLIL